jgi:hypothetical protein
MPSPVGCVALFKSLKWSPWEAETTGESGLGYGRQRSLAYVCRYTGGSCRGAFAVGDAFVAITWLGYGYTIGNSSHVTTQDVTIRASPYMAVAEIDGHGAHIYRNVSITAGPGRLISVNADGIHSEAKFKRE